jgi:uncharacterized protein (TIGR03083 family)
MDAGALIDQLEEDGPRLAAAAQRAGLDAPVPATEWTVRDLVTHTGGVHRWAAATVAAGAPGPDEQTGAGVGSGPPDAELLDWFVAGHAHLVQVLRAAPDDLTAFTFLPAPTAKTFWARRQAHETGIHRADAEAAAGTVPQFPMRFAQDGMAELITGFAARRSQAIAQPGTLALRPTDGGTSWRLTFGGERIVAEPSVEPADATVSGLSSELYLWLWNRPARVEIGGDATLAARWREVRVTWS